MGAKFPTPLPDHLRNTPMPAPGAAPPPQRDDRKKTNPMHFPGGWSPVIAEFYQSLGLNPAHIKSFTLNASINSIVSAEVEYFVEADGIREATGVVKKYHLGLVEVETKTAKPVGQEPVPGGLFGSAGVASSGSSFKTYKPTEPEPTKSIPPKPDPPKTREVVRGLFSFWPW